MRSNDVAVLGVGMHPWGKWGRSFVSYGVDAARKALADAGVDWQDVGLIVGGETVRNGYGGYVAGATFAQALGWNGARVATSYAACATGAQALDTARSDLQHVIGPGVDLVANDPAKADRLLRDAIAQLDLAGSSGIPKTTLDPIRAQVVTALDRLNKMTDVLDASIFTFPGATPVDLRALVQGPDGAPYVLDAATQTVYRIDLAHNKATSIFRLGTKAAGATEAEPKLIAVGGRDLVIIDAKNVVWKWRPANTSGKGTLLRVHVDGATEWGDDILAIGTFIRNANSNLYNLYVIDPSAQSIWAYAPAADGSGAYPATPTNRLATARDVSDVTAMYIDGDIWLAEGGKILRLVNGNSEGWTARPPGDDILRPAPLYRLVTSASARRSGTLYGFDAPNLRVIAMTKIAGAFVQQFRIGSDSQVWSDLRAWYIEPGVSDAPDAIVWISGTTIHRTILEAATSVEASPGPSSSPSASPGASGGASPAPSR